jgi:pantoate--beta-alanine ligase
MRIVRTIAELREALAAARGAGSAGAGSAPSRVGMVPTMGALHEGHLSLVRAARAENDTVVLSIFVNPTQFNEAADLAAYPRQEKRDAALAAEAGVDLIFAPDAAEMYPQGFATSVRVTGPLAETLEGAARGASHFDGVATVVSKLLLAALPDSAYFGRKDAQQLLVVTRMVADLGIPTRIVACPTSRDPDGLARSSRNVHLGARERQRALAIPRALEAAAESTAAGERDAGLLRARAEEMLHEAGLEVEYVAVVHPETLEPLDRIEGSALLAIAVRAGEVRLIDNAVLRIAEGDPQASR